MAEDLTIQLFAHELFNRLWADIGDKGRPYLAVRYPGSLNVENHITPEIIDAVISRQIIFRGLYIKQFKHTGIAYCDNPSAFLAHLCVAFDDATFQELKVFDRIIATCAFAMEMSLYCFVRKNKYFLKDDFQCWAMYFDTELKSTFYEQGGWKVLKCVAKSYVLPFMALRTLSYTPFYILVHLQKFAMSMDEFYYFNMFHDVGNQTCAKTWANFRLKNGKNPEENRFDIETVEGMEVFLTCFKFLCDPLGERILEDDVHRLNENLISKFKGNGYLENLAMKLSNDDASYPTKQNSNFKDDLEISQSSEVFEGQNDAEEGLTKKFQALKISRLSNSDKSLEHPVTTGQLMLNTIDILNDSSVNETNSLPKYSITEEEYKQLWDQVIETNNFLNNLTATDEIKPKKAAADQRLPTQDAENNLLKGNAPAHENVEENTDSDTGLLKTYELRRKAMNANCILTMLNHVPVFINDHRIIHVEKEFVPNKTRQVKENSNARLVKNETSQIIKDSLEKLEVHNGTESKKKKKRKTKKAHVDDTKDILRLALVLGCQPSVDYIRSTLTQSRQTTSV